MVDATRDADLFNALGHPSRLRMALALTGGETCVCKLQELVGSDMSTVSKHLAVLRAAGLLENRKQGLWVHYRLKPEGLQRLVACAGVLSSVATSGTASNCGESTPAPQVGTRA